jgi:hypothetical protein
VTPATFLRALQVPLRSAPLILIALFSVALTIAANVGLFGIPLAVILSSWYLKYTFAILDVAAAGTAEPPVLSVEMVNPLSEGRALVLLVLVGAVFFASGAVRYWFGNAGAVLVSLLAFVILPGVIAVQGVSGSILQSLNPRVWYGTVRQLGVDYVWLLLAIGGIAGLAAIATIGPLLGAIAFLMYAGLAIQALIGGVLHEHRNEAWFEEASLPQRRVTGEDPHLEAKRRNFVDAVYAEWRNGAQQNAWRDVVAQYEKSDEPLDELRWMYQRIEVWPDQRLANRIAQELVRRLLEQKNHSESFRLVRQRLKADRDFRPVASADLIRLVTLARDVGDRATARALLREFERFYPQDPQRTMAEELRRQVERQDPV